MELSCAGGNFDGGETMASGEVRATSRLTLRVHRRAEPGLRGPTRRVGYEKTERADNLRCDVEATARGVVVSQSPGRAWSSLPDGVLLAIALDAHREGFCAALAGLHRAH